MTCAVCLMSSCIEFMHIMYSVFTALYGLPIDFLFCVPVCMFISVEAFVHIVLDGALMCTTTPDTLF